ncbi:MAG: nitroreductase family protein [Chloroflexi bacterium]|nr:nitroreductase family protein [Chloroflexota bacterium]
MEIDNLLELARKRRCIRRFKPDPIPDGHVEKILEVARWAMSGANGQPWEFVVVRNQETREKIVDLLAEHRKRTHLMESTRIEALRHPGAGAPRTGPPYVKDAPVIIVVCGDPRTFQATVLDTHFSSGEGATFHMNIGNATHMIHLAAAALGLGSQWVSVTRPMERGLKELLHIPEMLRIFVMVPIGYRGYEPGISYRRELNEIVHYDSYDSGKYRSDEDVIAFLAELRKRTTGSYRTH